MGLFLATLRRLERAAATPRASADTWLFTGIFAVGSFYFPYATCGLFWYLSHLTAVFFVVLALFCWLSPRRDTGTAFAAGLALGAATLARYQVPLLVPIFVLLALGERRREGGQGWLRRLGGLSVGLGLGLVAVLLHNLARFGDPLVLGHPVGVAHPLWSLEKVVPHLLNVFCTYPYLYPGPPWVGVSMEGLSLFLTLPVFVFLPRLDRRDPLQAALILGVVPCFAFLMGYGTNGFTQWGYRYLLELLPFLVAGLFLVHPRVRHPRAFLALAWLGLVVNSYGAAILYRGSALAWTPETFLQNVR